MMNFSDVTKGWKVYALTWTWLGIAAGLASDTSGEALSFAFVVWAFGASVGWLLASTIRHKGWTVALCYFGGAVGAIAVTLIGIRQYNMREPIQKRGGIQINWERLDAYSKEEAAARRSLCFAQADNWYKPEQWTGGAAAAVKEAKQKAERDCNAVNANDAFNDAFRIQPFKQRP